LAEWPESDGFAKAGALKTTPASSAGMIAFTILLLSIIMSLPFLNCQRGEGLTDPRRGSWNKMCAAWPFDATK
jgi:hypothetical protein